MDSSRFDNLTRRIASVDRRGALRTLGGVVVGGAVAGLPLGRRSMSVLACGTPGQPCTLNEHCCGANGASPGTCTIPAGQASGTCTKECKKGYKLRDGKCVSTAAPKKKKTKKKKDKGKKKKKR
jgi:hypothetical protein